MEDDFRSLVEKTRNALALGFDHVDLALYYIELISQAADVPVRELLARLDSRATQVIHED